ncbi:C10 family peptidase, partial [Flavobacterium filum]|uniref:C10 family peptidase n=1 Tax=Flavobacterium filum TaxID=370974 RepID=UPI0023F46051
NDYWWDFQWIDLLKSDLDASRPIQYVGSGSGGGHTWVCDGYDNNDYFHMNWGWGGNSDGYFDLDYLNPGSLGTGGGTGGFNSHQQAVIGIQPPSGGANVDIELFSDVTVYPNPIEYGQSFTVNANITNNSSSTFYGYITAALFDANLNFVDFIQTLNESSGLPNGYNYTNGLNFSTSGLNASPGDYYVGIFILPSGSNQWHYVQNGLYENLVPISIVFYNDIELYSDITINPQVIIRNQPASFNYDIANLSGYQFDGSFSIDLHDLEGNWLQTIDQLDGVTLCNNCHFTGGLDFNTSGLNVESGTYIIAAWEYEDWSGWYLLGSTTSYDNPVYVTIATPPLNPDSYENNNTESSASTLTLNFIGNNASKKTSNANIHIGTDYDYYKINLPSGYDYNITARAQDSYNSNDGQTYTNDVLWSYKIDNGIWSDAYDDIMPNTIFVPNGGLVKFHLSPYFQGETGTYALDMSISRTVATGIDNPETQTLILYPNPANNIVKFINGNHTNPNDKISIYNTIGQKVYENNFCDIVNYAIDLSNYSHGVYFVVLSNEWGNLSQKLIIK